MHVELETTRRALEQNNYACHLVPGRTDVVPLLQGLLPQNATVAVGGSTTLIQCGVIDYLRAGPYNFLDRHAEGLTTEGREQIFHASKTADVYLCSANAVTAVGELYNVDGHSNRVSALAHGPKQVILVVGQNKLVPTLADAVRRVKTLTAPAVCKRAGRKTPCAATGRCIDVGGGMAAGCKSPERTCIHFLVSGFQREQGRVHVILVEEDLGL